MMMSAEKLCRKTIAYAGVFAAFLLADAVSTFVLEEVALLAEKTLPLNRAEKVPGVIRGALPPL